MVKILDLRVTTKYAPKNIFPIIISPISGNITKVKRKKRYEGHTCITGLYSLKMYLSDRDVPKFVQLKIREFLANELRAIPTKDYDKLSLREKRRIGREIWGVSTDNVVYNKWRGHTKEYHANYWQLNKHKYR